MNRELLTSTFCLAFAMLFGSAYAQQGPEYEDVGASTASNIVPPSPEASSFAKFIENPISEASGSVSIPIPIHTVSVRDLSIPIGLNYHTGGVKVDEIATSVGLNWSLNAGGAITRTVVGIPDETGGVGYINIDTVRSTFNNTEDDGEYLMDVVNGLKDSEPDVFYYNFPGGSGKFVFDQDKNIHLIPLRKLKITPPLTFGGTGSHWEIIDETGGIYRFGENGAIDVTIQEEAQCNYSANTVSIINSTWHMTKMSSYESDEEITLNYTNYKTHYTMGVSETLYKAHPVVATWCNEELASSNTGPCYNTFEMDVKAITSIDFNGGKVNFNYTQERIDIDNGTPALKTIDILDNNLDMIKSFELNYQNVVPLNNDIARSSYENVRMFLSSVTEKGSDNIPLPPHEFVYYEPEKLPARNTFGQDYWGFYNGKDSNPSLVDRDNVYVEGGDRSVDTLVAHYGAIKSVKYPTGGVTEFSYESNRYDSTQMAVIPQPTLNGLVRWGSIYASDIHEWRDTFNIVTPSWITYSHSLKKEVVQGQSEVMDPDASVFLIVRELQDTLNIVFQRSVSDYGEENAIDAYMFVESAEYEVLLRIQLPQSNDTYWGQASIDYSHSQMTTGTFFVGGIRVNEVRQFEHSTALQPELITEYDYWDAKLISPSPVYYGTAINSRYLPLSGEPNNVACGTGDCEFFTKSASSKVFLSTNNGNPVYYGGVTIRKKDGIGVSQGFAKNYYRYTEDLDFSNQFPYPPTFSNSHKRGFLIKSEYYKMDSSLVHRTETEYVVDTVELNTDIKALKVGTIRYGDFCTLINVQGIFAWKPYYLSSEWIYKSKEITTSFYSGDSIEVIRTYDYNAHNNRHLEPTKITTNGSDGVTLEERLLYSSSQSVLSSIWGDKNYRSELIKKATYKNGVAGAVWEKRLMLNPTSDLIQLDSTVVYPILAPNLPLAEIPNVTTKFKYDIEGHIIETQASNSYNVAYIWTQDGRFPIAKIENASYQSGDIQDGSGNVFSSTKITELQLNSSLDSKWVELRTLLPAAFITSYVYDEAGRPIRSMDPNGFNTNYTYDRHSRLSEVRDDQNNLVRKTIYHYREQ